jgi:hypothetical protein
MIERNMPTAVYTTVRPIVAHTINFNQIGKSSILFSPRQALGALSNQDNKVHRRIDSETVGQGRI